MKAPHLRAHIGRTSVSISNIFLGPIAQSGFRALDSYANSRQSNRGVVGSNSRNGYENPTGPIATWLMITGGDYNGS